MKHFDLPDPIPKPPPSRLQRVLKWLWHSIAVIVTLRARIARDNRHSRRFPSN